MPSTLSGDADVGELTNSLLEQKKNELKSAQNTDIASATIRTGTGVVAGFFSGVAVVFASALSLVKRVLNSSSELKNSFEQSKNKSFSTVEEQERYIKSFSEEFGKAFEKEANLSAGADILKHSGKWVLGLTAVGAIAGGLSYKRSHDKKVDKVSDELNKLEKIHSGWAEKIKSEGKSVDDVEKSR